MDVQNDCKTGHTIGGVAHSHQSETAGGSNEAAKCARDGLFAGHRTACGVGLLEDRFAKRGSQRFEHPLVFNRQATLSMYTSRAAAWSASVCASA